LTRRGPAKFIPSGRQTSLVAGDQRAVVVEVGGGIREYSAGGVPVLDGYSEADMCDGARGQALLPWPNRLEDGAYRFGDRDLQVPISEPSTTTAIHGLTRWSAWSRAGAGTSWAVLEHRLPAQPGFPWSLDVAIRYSLGPSGLDVTTTVVNRGEEACPFGLGFHPYLFGFGGAVDNLELKVPASSAYVADDRGLPVGCIPVDGTESDFRGGPVVGERRLDVCVTDLARDADGMASVELREAGPLSGRRVRLWVDESFTCLMLFTGDTLPEPSRRRRSVAVEPMTGPPNLLRTGDGLVVLRPGQPWEARWGVGPT
jgi:aldose 1-epimerase